MAPTKPPSTGTRPASSAGTTDARKRGVRLAHQRHGSRVVVVGDDGAARIDPFAGHAGADQRGRDDARAEQLAHRRHDVERPGRDLPQHRQRPHDGGELIELLRRSARRGAAALLRAPAPRAAAQMPLAQLLRRAASACPRRPAPASAAIASSASVTPLIADTTTAGPAAVARARASRTISIRRRMASGSATDVPPNF